MRGTSSTVQKMKAAPRKPPENFHSGCCGRTASASGRPPRTSAATASAAVPHMKDTRAATTELAPTAAAIWLLMAAWKDTAMPAPKAMKNNRRFMRVRTKKRRIVAKPGRLAKPYG